jgi:predicted ATPase/DNA-binding CsgD family transcriptional regulator
VADLSIDTPRAASVRSALPAQLTSFIGRERELAEARRLLSNARLLTLTGPGGSGKTRLSLKLAAEEEPRFSAGAHFVSLVPIKDPELVAASTVESLGLPTSGPGSPLNRLIDHLRDKQLLLVLDNFEHLLPAATMVTQLLRECADLRIVVSSRAPLKISGEQELPIPPMRLPDSDGDAAGCESVQLFVERARELSPSFSLDASNRAAICEVVRRLDGLPLAVELAAARIRVLTPEELSGRLENSLGLLVGRHSDVHERQRTLRNTIAWSYELLRPDAKRLLAVCSVFRGGATLDMIEKVSGAPALDGLEELVEQNLLRPAPRFGMLETIREFAQERLDVMREAPLIRDVHASAYAALARQGVSMLIGSEQGPWLERLRMEHNNIRAALDHLEEHSPREALALAIALADFWLPLGYAAEGKRRLSALVDKVDPDSAERAAGLAELANLEVNQGEYQSAQAHAQQALELNRTRGDRRVDGRASVYLGRALMSSGQPGAARPLLEHGLEVLTSIQDHHAAVMAASFRGLSALFSGRVDEAVTLLRRAIEMCEEIGYESMGMRITQQLGCALVQKGDLAGARLALTKGIAFSRGTGETFVIGVGLMGFAGLAAKTGRPRLGLRLAGAAEGFSGANQFTLPASLKAMMERWVQPAAQKLGAEGARIRDEGRTINVDEAIRLALENPPDARRAGPAQVLTKREFEVASLVADGLTNREVAGRLHLSVRTVDVHLDHVLTKLGFHNRSQLVAWAYEEKILPKNT